MSAATAAASAAALANRRQQYNKNLNTANNSSLNSLTAVITGNNFQYSLIRPTLIKYNYQKSRDWNIFRQFLRNHCPTIVQNRCSGPHVVEFLRHLDQFGKIKVHCENCRFFGECQSSSSSCLCPLKQGWGSLDAMVGRLRAAFYEENGGSVEMNPFESHAVKLYLREVRDEQARAMGVKITY